MGLLDKPLRIGKIWLKNRLVMPPMASGKGTEEGQVTADILSYYDGKTKGGHIGLVIVEHGYVSKEGKASANQLSYSKDEDVKGLRELTKLIHENGSLAFAQLSHAGSATTKGITGMEQLSASSLDYPRFNALSSKNGLSLPKARAMGEEDIRKVIDDFKSAARRAKEAGFDGVEIHSAHGYLLNQFYSPLSNKRDDEYGGPLMNRLRLHLEIIKAIKEEVGNDYPIAVRLGADDFQAGGTTIHDSVEAARIFEKEGLALLDVSGGFSGYLNPLSKEPGYFKELTKALREAVSLPVILTGGITKREEAERLLEGGKADLIGVGRAILKDDDWAKTAMEAEEN